MLQRLARLGLVLLCAGVALLLGIAPALAAPAPPRTRCELRDPRLAEASGLVDAPGGPEVVDDSGNPSTVYRLDPTCRVSGEVPVRRAGADVEDLARGADGTLWLADTGDNRRTRRQVAMLRVAPDGAESEQPLAYADGPHDAEALILPADGRPVIVTKDLGGHSGVYTTDVPLPRAAAPGAQPMVLRRVGELLVPPSKTRSASADAQAALGGGLVTGGALSADGRMVAVRTYTDAWLYRVAGRPGTATSVVAALRAAPVQVPLPDEPQGEAIAFAPDGTLLSAGESPAGVNGAPAPRRGALRVVPGAVAAAEAQQPRGADQGGATPAAPAPAPAAASSAHLSAGHGGTSPAQWIAAAIVLVLGGGLLAAATLRERRRLR